MNLKPSWRIFQGKIEVSTCAREESAHSLAFALADSLEGSLLLAPVRVHRVI